MEMILVYAIAEIQSNNRKLGITFIVLAFISSAYFLLAENTGNAMVRYFEMGQLAVSILCAILFLAKKIRIFSVATAVFIAMNMLPLWIWLTEPRANFWLFGWNFTANFPMVLLHLAILLIGVVHILSTRKMIKVLKMNINYSVQDVV